MPPVARRRRGRGPVPPGRSVLERSSTRLFGELDHEDEVAMTVPKPMPRRRSAAERARTRSFALSLLAFFAVLAALDLIITGIGSPPPNVPPVTLAENTGVPP